jgi:hypothetical protein
MLQEVEVWSLGSSVVVVTTATSRCAHGPDTEITIFDSWVPFPGNPSIYTMLTEFTGGVTAVTSGLRRELSEGARLSLIELLIARHIIAVAATTTLATHLPAVPW